MKKFFSRKYSKIFSYDALVKAQNKSSNNHDKLLIHTANGIYQGYLKDFEDYTNYDINKDDDILTAVRKLYLSTVDNYKASDCSEIVENPIAIDLEDVTLYTSMKSVTMPFVSIFVDQIIGISLGHI